ncbi:MAG: hypothetical protein IT428_33490 [Planctomycetaceae bacterium]|nr:hypothetical protein [Planctomycetaceae bacterium]
MSDLLGWKCTPISAILGDFSDSLRRWIYEMVADDAYDISGLLNNLYNENRTECSNFVSSLDVKTIAEKVSNISLEKGYLWGSFFDRLCCCAPEEWLQHLTKSLPRDALFAIARRCTADKCWEMAHVIKAFYWMDNDLGRDCLEIAMPAFCDLFGKDALAAYRDVGELEYYALGIPLFSTPRPTQRQRSLALQMFDAILPDIFAKQLVSCRFGDWEFYSRLLHWIAIVSRLTLQKFVDAIDWRSFDDAIGEMWKVPPRELRLLLRTLAMAKEPAAVSQFIRDHYRKSDVFDPMIVLICPDAAIHAAKSGRRIALDGHNGSDWELQAVALRAIDENDREVAKNVLRQNREHLIRSLTNLSLPDGMPLLIDIVEAIDQGFMLEIIQSIDSTECEEKWSRALKDHRSEERKAARDVIKRIHATRCDRISEMAKKLLSTVRYRQRGNSGKEG